MEDQSTVAVSALKAHTVLAAQVLYIAGKVLQGQLASDLALTAVLELLDGPEGRSAASLAQGVLPGFEPWLLEEPDRQRADLAISHAARTR